MKHPKLIKIKQFKDESGILAVAETKKEIPFEIKRIFSISHVPFSEVRGNHASKSSEFIYICLSGTVKVYLTDGKTEAIFCLDSSAQGLYLPEKIWMKFYDFSEDAVLLVLASEHYSKEDYCESFHSFIKERENE